VFDVSLDPLTHFTRLLDAAKSRGEPEYNAMALATAGADHKPSVRIVYFKGLVRGGLSFFGNYHSAKAKAIATNPWVCANFYYPIPWEQIRVTGRAEKLTRTESEAYFKTRARLSQIGAWASNQSEEIPNPEFLQSRLAEFEKTFAGKDVPCPENWGGYLIVPEEFEFWFGKNGRLHERYIYQLQNKKWNSILRGP
jgi:pyridoxamine 5'-phosphate oxidase